MKQIGGKMEKQQTNCDLCKFAIYDSVPYGLGSVAYLSGCLKEEELTEEETENKVECSKFEMDTEP